MTTNIFNRNYASLERALQAELKLIVALQTGRTGLPMNIFGQPVEQGLSVYVDITLRKFTGSAWEGIKDTKLWLNFTDEAALARARAAMVPRVEEELAENDSAQVYVLRVQLP